VSIRFGKFNISWFQNYFIATKLTLHELLDLGAQPSGICDSAPIMLRSYCTKPIDYIREVGIFMSLGVLFAGISVATQTFGNERVVFWRDTAAGMPTLPYFIAKVIVEYVCRRLRLTFTLLVSLHVRPFRLILKLCVVFQELSLRQGCFLYRWFCFGRIAVTLPNSI
jgi:hypothetical protein